MDQIAQQLVNGVLIGLIYALLAIGLTLIWGVMNVLNFAHGEFLMIGMFMSYWLYSLAGIDPIFSIPVNAVALFLLGMFCYRYVISKVMQGPGLAQLVVTFGVSIFLANLAAWVWTPNYRSIQDSLLSGTWDLSGVKIGIAKLVSSAGSVVTSFAVFWFLRNTKTGKAILAVEMDREAAMIMGINTERINSLSFAIGSALVGVAGALLATHYYIFPFVGGTFGLICFCIVALGGFGSVEGAFIAGILVGVVQTVGGFLLDPSYKLAIVFLMYLVTVWIRPQGLRGW